MSWFWQDEKYLAKIKELEAEIEELKKPKENPPKIPPDLQERVADLEVKMSKLWTLLLEKDMRGRDKLTKHGRLFGGKLSQ